MMIARLETILKEPFSALTHGAACLLAVLGTIILVALTRHEPGKMLSLLVYGVSLAGLFAASSLFHGLRVRHRVRSWLHRADHMAIFILIAGSYTPVVYNFVRQPERWAILLAIWAIAVLGVLYKLFSAHIEGFFNVIIYVLLAWGAAIPLVIFLQPSALLSGTGLVLLLAGGLIYSGGFIIYYRRRPDPWPRVFGHHEIWHLCVIGGSLCHYFFMLTDVVPAAASA
jgi:hemolysin III